MLVRLAHGTAQPGRGGDLAALLAQVSAILAGFDGCERYEVCRRPDAPDEVWVVERWRDAEAMRGSLELPAVRELLPRARELMAEWAPAVDLEPLA